MKLTVNADPEKKEIYFTFIIDRNETEWRKEVENLLDIDVLVMKLNFNTDLEKKESYVTFTANWNNSEWKNDAEKILNVFK